MRRRNEVSKLALYLFLIFWFLKSAPADLEAQETRDPQGIAREHYYQGVFYGKQENYHEAILELEKAIALYPAYADAYNALAVIYHRQKEYQKSIDQYLLAIEANPAHAKARTNLAMIYNEQKQYQKALRQLEKALEIDPQYPSANQLIDGVRQKVEAQDATERERQQAERERQQKEKKRVDPPPSGQKQKPAKAFFTSGTALIQQGKIDAGIREYRKGLERHPRSVEGYTLLAMAYREKYRITHDSTWKEQEISAFMKAVSYDHTYVPALLGLGETSYEQGDISEAIRYFRKVLQHQPDHPAKEQLEEIIQQHQ